MTTRQLLSGLGTILALIVIPTIINLITPLTTVQDVIDFILKRTVDVAVWQLIAAFVVLLASAILVNHMIQARDKKLKDMSHAHDETLRQMSRIHDEKIADLQARLHAKDQTISAIQSHLHDARQLRFLDVVTGIPNEAKWKADVTALAPTASSDVPYHVALIDLVKFGRLNDQLGYQKVDEILRYLARSLDDNMRKNEGLYKRHLVDNALLPERLYRKYPGGDEFYLVAGGSEADMLGLLTRLQRLITREIDPHISKEIAKTKVDILFSGAVCMLGRDEDPDALTRRLIDCLRPTRYDGAPTRLVWESRKHSWDFAEGTAERRIYEHAEKEFAASKPAREQPK